MANRYFNQFRYSLEKKVVDIFSHMTFGGGGAVTLDAANSKGVVSVTHDAAGKYTFVFGTQAGMLDVYKSLLNVQGVFKNSVAPVSPVISVTTDNSGVAGSASIQVLLSVGGVATDPASGEQLYLQFTFKDSTAI